MQPSEGRQLYFISSTTDNMNFILVPFLLAIQVPSDQDKWKHGPEYVFNVRASMITDLIEDNNQYHGTSLINKLKCRVNEPDRLSCHFEGSKFTRFTPRAFEKDATIVERNATFSVFGFGNTSFEMKFNERGIESYDFLNDERAMPEYLVNMYRTIANHLSLGAKIEGDSAFRRMENFTIGECSVSFNFSRRMSEERIKRRKYEIVPLIDLERDEILEVKKKRHLEDCLPHPVYFFGTRYTYGIILRDTIDKLVSSSSRMVISKSSFVSESVHIVDVYDTSREKVGVVLDHIQLSLESVKPASGCVQAISSVLSTNVVVERYKDKCL